MIRSQKIIILDIVTEREYQLRVITLLYSLLAILAYLFLVEHLDLAYSLARGRHHHLNIRALVRTSTGGYLSISLSLFRPDLQNRNWKEMEPI